MSVTAADISMLLISLASVLHIHMNSKVIERLGIKTDSTLMKLYAFCWIGTNLFDIVLFTLSFLIIHEWYDYYWMKHMELVKTLRLQIAYISIFMVVTVFLFLLNSLILSAYNRLSRKLSA